MSDTPSSPAVAAVRGGNTILPVTYDAFHPGHIAATIRRVRDSVDVVVRSSDNARGLDCARESLRAPGYATAGTLPAMYPEWLGDPGFGRYYGVRFPYIAGEMANGIATTAMVTAMARADMLGVFGAAGLDSTRVEQAVDELSTALPGRRNWGVNLIHSPGEPELEDRVAELLITRDVPVISASAFMDLTPAVVRCSAAGLHVDGFGRILRRAGLLAKVSRPEVAEKFLSPAPAAMLAALVERGHLTPMEAELAARVPVATDLTVESDSGGHTDNRPLGSLFPAIVSQRDTLAERFGYPQPPRIGAAGGLGTPTAVAAAFALGASYVLTGTVNQVACESGLSRDARELLTRADVADVTMAPAPDMFEAGVKVQVLGRETMYAPRAKQLYELYRTLPGLDNLPAETRNRLETTVFHSSLDEVWDQTRRFWQERDPRQISRADRDSKHRMALVFRWYLGQSSRWAIEGETARRTDYQIWCGPAMGAFNRWIAGSPLAEQRNRSVVQIALNLLEGAAVVTRAHQARTYGVAVPAAAFSFPPRRLA